MPKMIIHSPAGTFDADDRRQVAKALTALGLECEALPRSAFVRSTVWTYFAEYAADAVFMGEDPASLPVVTLEINVLAGGLNNNSKRKLIKEATAILDRGPTGASVAPVSVLIKEVAEENWGIFGKQADLAALRTSALDAPVVS